MHLVFYKMYIYQIQRTLKGFICRDKTPEISNAKVKQKKL